MGHQHTAGTAHPDLLGKSLLSGDIDMIGRFIEQVEVWFFKTQCKQRNTRSLAKG